MEENQKKGHAEIDPEGRYNAKEAASLIEVSRTSFYSIVKQGKIKQRYNNFSPRAYYLGRDLLRLLNVI